jgi:pyruvate/2-oxoacid:ferredoxin oxidoreductase beta subunit
LKSKVWISKVSNLKKNWSLFNGKGCEMIKKKHHHWIIGGDGVVNSKGINKGVIDT